MSAVEKARDHVVLSIAHRYVIIQFFKKDNVSLMGLQMIDHRRALAATITAGVFF